MRFLKSSALALLLLLACVSAAPASTLSTLVAGMSAGSFALLNQGGDGSGYEVALYGGDFVVPSCMPQGSIFSFAQKAVYDPVLDKVEFTGESHSGSGTCPEIQVRYDVATNAWTKVTSPSPVGQGHAYDSNAINPAARKAYVSVQLLATGMRQLDLDTNTWSTMALPNTAGFGDGQEPTVTYFPERNELLWFQGRGNNGLGKYKFPIDVWSTVSGLPSLANIGTRGAIATYSIACKCVVFMGGMDVAQVAGTPSTRYSGVFRYNRDGTFTTLTSLPSSIYIYPQHSIVVADPVTGKIIVWNVVLGAFNPANTGSPLNEYTGNFELWEFDPTGSGTWTQLNSAIIPPLSGWGISSNSLAAIVGVPISKYGVILYMSGHNTASNGKVYAYKHAASSWASAGKTFEEKSAQPGVLYSIKFNAQSELNALKYATGGLASMTTELANRGYPTGSLSPVRASSEASILGNQMAATGQFTIPEIDTSVAPSGSSGSLRFYIPSQSQDNTGYVQLAIDGPPSVSTKQYVNPTSPIGTVLYYQYKFRTNAAMISTLFRAYHQRINDMSCPAGGRVLTRTTGCAFLGVSCDGTYTLTPGPFSYVDQYIVVLDGPNWVRGRYGPIISATSTTVTLDPSSASPCPAGNGTSGTVDFGRYGSVVTDYSAGGYGSGWKQHIFFGDAPAGSSSNGKIENTMANNRTYAGLTVGTGGFDGQHPQLYGEAGGDSGPSNSAFPYVADTWYEVSGRLEVKGRDEAALAVAGGDAHGDAASRSTLWIDGSTVLDWQNVKVAWNGSDGHGFGQFEITPFHTNKDPTQVHSDGYMYFGQLILSTQPIEFGSSGAPSPTPPASVVPLFYTLKARQN